MKLMCISCKGCNPLPITIGKIYEVLDVEHVPFSPTRYDDPSGPFYKIKCDNGEIKMIDCDKFRSLTLAEKRELKLKDLGI